MLIVLFSPSLDPGFPFLTLIQDYLLMKETIETRFRL